MSFNDKERLIVEQDIGQFEIYFEAIFDHPPSVKCFNDYLRATFNGESSEFLDCVNEYRKIKHERKRYQVAQDLYERFVADGANTQLNLRSDVRNRVQKALFPTDNQPKEVSSPQIMTRSDAQPINRTTSQQTPNSPPSSCSSPIPYTNARRNSIDSTASTDSSSESISSIKATNSTSSLASSVGVPASISCPKTLFDEIESVVLLCLKENNFKSFVESDYFKTFLKTQPLKILYEIGSIKEDSPLFYVESLGDLKNECFSVNDFKFLKSQFSNYDTNEWEVIGSSKHHKCYYSKKAYDMGESVGLNFFKFDVVFPYSVKQVMNTIFEKEYRLQYDGNLCEIEQIDFVQRKTSVEEPITGGSLLSSSITREIYKLTWPFNPREFIVSSSGIFDPSNNTYYVGKKSCLTKKVPNEPKKGVIRAISLGGWAFHALDENSCRYSQIFYLDFKGNIPKAVVKTLLKDRAKSFQKLGTKFIKINEKRGFICKESNEMWRTMEENGHITI